MRLIDADALTSALRHYQYPYGVEFLVSTQPTIEAEPVRHGRWEKIHYADEPVKTAYRCSVCHTTWDEPTNGCPYCRAKMNEENDE